MWRKRVGGAIIVAMASVLVSGCQTTGGPDAPTAAIPAASQPAALDSPAFPEKTLTVQDVNDVKYYPSDEPLRVGLEQFNRGNFALAERYFQDAVEKTPRDATAWVALAACYDRLMRFDLADRAYGQAIRLVGETTEILNNLGYSYMLRGELVKARKKFMQAYRREPGNPTIANNLKLLDASYKFARRPVAPEDAQ